MGGWRHLAAGFVDALSSRALAPAEIDQVRAWLRPDESEAYFSQPGFDQRHGLEAANFVFRQAPDRIDLIRAALLHDVGKRHSGLGPWSRSLASALAKIGGKPSGRWASYLDHGGLGATEMSAAGAEQLVVEFAREHHGDRPPSIAAEDWDILMKADRL
ncbi:MAG: HD domain-containing protein [Acidimicrobiia bacterium]